VEDVASPTEDAAAVVNTEGLGLELTEQACGGGVVAKNDMSYGNAAHGSAKAVVEARQAKPVRGVLA
jgi:hypothetical protein